MKLQAAFLGLLGLTLTAGELSDRRAPGFSLPDSQYRQYDPQDYRGRILIVEFMKTECEHCQAFTPILEEAVTKYGDKIAALSVVNPPDNQDAVRKYIADHKVTVPILFDCGQVAASYMKATPRNPTISIPHVFVIDKDGMIREDFGYNLMTRNVFEGKELFEVLDRMLAGAAKPGR